jgi:hypothetical protein
MIVIVDGPPATGKSTIAVLLAKRLDAGIYSFKRLGFVNFLAEFLLRITPSVSMLSGKGVSGGFRVIEVLKHERRDPILLIDSNFLKGITFIIFLLEIVYKCVRLFFLSVSVLIYRNIVVDEWFSLEWANYYNLVFHKKAFKPRHVEVLMRLDISFLRCLSRAKGIHVYFIDRDWRRLALFWRKRGHVMCYDTKYATLVKYFFNLFTYACREQKIDIEIKHLRLP